jgi:hypothetical protein
MASLHHHAAVLLTFGLLTGCGGDRSRAGAAMDTTGAAAVTPDSSAMPANDSASASHDTTPAAPAASDTAKRPTAVAPSETPPPAKAATRPASPPTKKPASARPTRDSSSAPTQRASRDSTPAHTADSAKAASAAPATDSAKTASAAAPAKPQQDTTAQTAEAPLIDAYHQPPRDTVTEAVYDGWKQFNLNCARCHGEDALGTTIAPHLILSLKPDGPINTKELFVQTVCAGRPTKGMPSWCALGLGIDKINDIYLYVKGRSDAKISPGRPAVKKEG